MIFFRALFILGATFGMIGNVMAAPITIDAENASLVFTVQHELGFTVGTFQDFSGTVELSDDRSHITSAVIIVRTASLNTNSVVRDDGLRSGLFLDADKFPEAKYENGVLTVKGISKPLQATLEPQSNGSTILRLTMNRNEFGMTYNKNLPQKKKSIGDMVELILEIRSP